MKRIELTKQDREILAAAGCTVPANTHCSAELKGYGLDWDDLGPFTFSIQCPYCKHGIAADQDTPEDIECPKCKGVIALEFGNIDVDAYISASPQITPADKKWLDWKKQTLAEAPHSKTNREG